MGCIAMKLQLNSGREIHLRYLRQWHPYEGMLEGLPTRQWNRKIIEEIVAEQTTPHAKPFLINPEEKPLEYIEGRKYPFGDPAALPGVACVARFLSFSPARNRDCFVSELLVIWFQHEFALPIDPQVVEHLQAIDWETLATDLEY
jgi:hypothetical protein